MSSLSTIKVVVGNIGRDVETKFTQNGKQVAKFSVAETERYKSGDEWKESTTWYNVEAWGPVAEAVKSLKKGQRVAVFGTLKVDAYTGQDGQAKASLVINAKEVGEMLYIDYKGDGSSRPSTSQRSNGDYDSYTPPSSPRDMDDIPF